MSLDLSQNEQTLRTSNEHDMVLSENAYVRELYYYKNIFYCNMHYSFRDNYSLVYESFTFIVIL